MGLQKRYLFSALLVLFSAFVLPFARVRWGDVFLELSDTRLYFIWGMFSFRSNRVRFYDTPYATPYDIQFIAVFWIVSSIILAVSVLSLAKYKHQSTKVRATIVVLFALQIILPFLVFGPDPNIWTYTISVTPFPIPSVLSFIVFSALLRIQRKSEFSKPYPRASLEAVSSDSRVR
ncbi:MAG: hypothetical protein ACTSSE_18780 [Candidatus Thorarchaeota archaeon]